MTYARYALDGVTRFGQRQAENPWRAEGYYRREQCNRNDGKRKALHKKREALYPI